MRTHRLLIGAVFVLFTAVLVVPSVVRAAHEFDDVDDSNIFIEDISWMADSGVTKGCSSNPPLFCPDDFVTREQMAAFMKRLATNQVVDAGSLDGKDGGAFLTAGDKATDADRLDGKDSSAFLTTSGKAADADKLDGKDSSAFMTATDLSTIVPRAAHASSDNLPDDDGIVLQATIVAPAAGVLLTGGTVDATVTAGGESTLTCGIGMEGTFIEGTFMFVTSNSTDPGSREVVCSTTGATTVAAGTHVVDMVVNVVVGDPANMLYFDGALWVQWVPYDGTGSVPSAASVFQPGREGAITYADVASAK